MRFVFVDEAGTSEAEPVTVVVGIIINADQQLMMAEAALAEALGAVPPEFKEGFIFHAKEIWGDEKYRERWSMADRLSLLRTVMSLPRRLGLAVSLSMIRRDAPIPENLNINISRAQFQHVHAFANCVVSADRYIRNYADLTEVATVVAEDVPEMRRFLAKAPTIYRDHPMILGPEHTIPTRRETEQGYRDQSGEIRVTRIRRAVHFVSKQDDPALQLADACAFAFRRFLAEQSFGDDFVNAVLGRPLEIDDYRGPSAFDNFYWHPRRY